MFESITSTLLQLSHIGTVIFGVMVVSIGITFITITGFMVLFLIYKQVFFPSQKKAESLQYTLFKQFALPFLNSAINDATKYVGEKMKDMHAEDSKPEKSETKNE